MQASRDFISENPIRFLRNPISAKSDCIQFSSVFFNSISIAIRCAQACLSYHIYSFHPIILWDEITAEYNVPLPPLCLIAQYPLRVYYTHLLEALAVLIVDHVLAYMSNDDSICSYYNKVDVHQGYRLCP